jgi:hypothetical protein
VGNEELPTWTRLRHPIFRITSLGKQRGFYPKGFGRTRSPEVALVSVMAGDSPEGLWKNGAQIEGSEAVDFVRNY